MSSLNLFSFPNPSKHAMVLEFTQPLTEINTEEFSENKGLKADNLITICELIV
jgi:hypothetical protein